MPKLSQQALEARRGRIEEAARELFIRRGFHATSMRDIAQGAGTSLGNLYNYYPTKEDILESIIGRYQKVIDARLRSIFDEVEEPFHPESLRRFGRMVRELVSAHSDFWLLMYIDVLEFENRHFRKMFEGLTATLRRRFAPYFRRLKAEGALYDGVDPAVGFTAAYMQFFNYFLVEKLFGGNRHLGLSDERVVEHLTEIFCRGVLRPEKLAEMASEPPAAAPGGAKGRARTKSKDS
jgi:AcrR family transcriptional regulator